MNPSELETALRSAPTWALVLVAGSVVVAIIAAGPFAGWCLERKRTAPERAFTRAAAAKWIETGEIDLTELRAEERARLALKLPRTGDSGFRMAVEPDPVVVIRDDRPTSIITVVDLDGADRPQNTPRWAEATAEWTIQDPDANVFDAEIIEEDEEPREEEPEHSFWEDPLNAWTLPDELLEGPYQLPTAQETFSFMVRADYLTGIGADIDVEWAAWNLYEQGANA